MLIHVVNIKLAKKENKELVKDNFLKLKETIKEIREINIFENSYEKRIENFDLICFVKFDNLEDMEYYLTCDKHVEFVGEYVKPNAEKIATIDYFE